MTQTRPGGPGRSTLPTRLLLGSVLALAALVLVGCGEEVSRTAQQQPAAPSDPTAPSDPPLTQTVTGTITAVTLSDTSAGEEPCPVGTDDDKPVISDDRPCVAHADSVRGTVLVEALPARDDGEKFSFTISYDTLLVQEVSGTAGPTSYAISFDDLRGGMKVRVMYSGPVAESYPAQADADTVAVTE